MTNKQQINQSNQTKANQNASSQNTSITINSERFSFCMIDLCCYVIIYVDLREMLIEKQSY